MPRLPDEDINFFRNTKGNPLTVLVALGRLGGRSGTKELMSITQISDKPIAKALERLRALGYVEQRTRFNGWCLTNEGKQLPLFDTSRNISVSAYSSSSLLSLTSLLVLLNNLNTTTIQSSRRFSVSDDLSRFLTSKEVWINKQPDIAEKLKNSVDRAALYFVDGIDTPLAIHKIMNDLPPPSEWEIQKRRKEGGRRPPEDYAKGPHADFFENEDNEDGEIITIERAIDPEANKLWQGISGQLQMEMAKATYDTWVKNTIPVSLTETTFTLGSMNDYGRDWLESRLTSTIKRLATGIANREIEVEFITMQDG